MKDSPFERFSGGALFGSQKVRIRNFVEAGKQMKDSAIILSESRKIISATDTLRTPIEELTPSARVLAWQVLDLIEKNAIKGRKEQLRQALFDLADELGEENDHGSKKFEMEGATITKVRKNGKVTYRIEDLSKLLHVKGIDPNLVIDSIVSYEVNERKLTQLIREKKITVEELMEVTTVAEDTFSLKVNKSEQVLNLLK